MLTFGQGPLPSPSHVPKISPPAPHRKPLHSPPHTGFLQISAPLPPRGFPPRLPTPAPARGEPLRLPGEAERRHQQAGVHLRGFQLFKLPEGWPPWPGDGCELRCLKVDALLLTVENTPKGENIPHPSPGEKIRTNKRITR